MITFRYNSLERSVGLDEALLLRDWVRLERTLAGVRLTGQVAAAINAESPGPIELDNELRHALCNALGDEEFDPGHTGLAGLHDLCAGIDTR